MTTRRKFDDMPAAQQAGLLCNTADFQRFGSHRLGLAERLNVSGAAEFLRRQCGIQSRSELTDNTPARARFAALRTDYDAWRGQLAQQR